MLILLFIEGHKFFNLKTKNLKKMIKGKESCKYCLVRQTWIISAVILVIGITVVSLSNYKLLGTVKKMDVQIVNKN